MKVYRVVIQHYDEYIAGHKYVFANEEDATRFAELRDEAFSEGYTAVHEEEVYESLEEVLDEGEGASFCEMYLDDARQLPDELKPYDLEEEEITQ